jgi:hypothetical protein
MRARLTLPRRYVDGALDLVGAFGSYSQATKVCFAGDTPLLTPDGHKRIDQFKPGDLILTAPEHDPNAPLEVKPVEEVFTNHCRLLNVHVGGQVIQSTDEHPFYVRNKGWTSAKDLQIGDLLRSHDERWLPVEDLCDSGEDAPVYNLRIADYHTYFVASREWGFSVWAHNACGPLHGNSFSNTKPTTLYALYSKTGQFLKHGITNNPLTRYPKAIRGMTRLVPIATGMRSKMAALEKLLVKQIPGPWNREPWRGVLMPR